MEIMKQNKVILENDVATRTNPDPISGIYLIAAKVADMWKTKVEKRNIQKI